MIEKFLNTWPGIFLLLILGFYYLRKLYKMKKSRENVNMLIHRYIIFGGFGCTIVGLYTLILKLLGKI